MSTNLTTFSANGGKLIFYHGDSDPWFSPLDTFGYYKDMADRQRRSRSRIPSGANSILFRE